MSAMRYLLALRGGVARYFSCSDKFAFDLNKTDTAILKAISIMMVVFHNYWHNVFGAPGQNEHYFSSAAIGRVWNALLNTPFDFIHPLTSFFGHYGVHMFIFLSGYGLTKKLISVMKSEENKEWGLSDIYRQIVVKQLIKIFKLILVGLLFLYLVRACQSGNFEIPGKSFWTGFLLFCTFTQNFRPNQLNAFCTVWWFLALIVQLYVLFPLLVKAVKKYPEQSLLVLMLLTVVCGALSGTVHRHFHFYIISTPFAQSILFAFGIYCAMGHKLPKSFYLIAFVVFPLSWRYRFFFPFSFISLVLISVFLYEKFKSYLNAPWLVYIGQLSMFIYITHGDIRWPLLKAVNQSRSLFVAYTTFFGYLIVCFVVAWLCRATARALRMLK